MTLALRLPMVTLSAVVLLAACGSGASRSGVASETQGGGSASPGANPDAEPSGDDGHEGRGDEERPRFDQIRFAIVTGTSELSLASAAGATLRTGKGRTLQHVALKAASQPAWKASTTHTATFALGRRVDACDVGLLDVTLLPSGGADSWSVQAITATLSIDDVDQTVVLSDSGAPLAQLTSANPTVRLGVPCKRHVPLYERLGGRHGIVAVVDDFVARLRKDARIATFFRPIAASEGRLHRFEERVIRKMCELSGGPCLEQEHRDVSPFAGLGATAADYRAIFDDLVAAMARFPATASVKDKNELLGAPLIGQGVAGAATRTAATCTAVSGGAMATPAYVNLYWDTTWNADHPAVQKEALDSYVKAVLGSSYFAGLSEYGVGAGRFLGGFLPSSSCTPKAPAKVGFYDPLNPSIIGFLQCELDNDPAVPQGDGIIYNLILPSPSVESDGITTLFGLTPFCTTTSSGRSPGAWHFHATPYSAGLVLGGLLGWVIGSAVGDPAQGALIGFLVALSQQGGPFYTISFAASACGNLTGNVLHEMVEAATDPSPPFSVITTGSGEVADQCECLTGSCGCATASASFDPTSALPAGVTLAGAFLMSQVPQYWSNSGQKCVTGFGSASTPSVSGVALSGVFPGTAVTITGSGFGTVPASFPVPTSTNLPYLGIQDQNASPTWQAGNSLNADRVGLTVTSWTDTSISISAFSAPDATVAMAAGDALTAWVCNPASGLCGSGSGSASAGGSCGTGGTCCPAGQAACGGICCPNPSDVCDPATNTCTLACPGGCAAGQLCCMGSGGLECVTPMGPEGGHPWCGEIAPDTIFCDNCPATQSCLSICHGGLCTTDLFCQ